MNHTHQHAADVDWARVVDDLDRAALASAPRDLAIVEWLDPAPGARVCDIGCGAGNITVLLATAVGSAGAVLAVDGEPALLATTVRRCTDAGVGEQVRPVRHDLADPAAELPFEQPPDLIWAAGVLHHLPEQQAAVDRLAAALAVGGRLAVAEGGLSSRCLPWDLGVGAPGLEERLAAAEHAWFADMRGGMDGARRMPYGWSGALRAAGLAEVTVHSFLLDLPPPLDGGVRDHVTGGLASRVERTTDRLDADDRAAWQRLLDPAHADYLGHRDDVYVLAVTTVHVGTRG